MYLSFLAFFLLFMPPNSDIQESSFALVFKFIAITFSFGNKGLSHHHHKWNTYLGRHLKFHKSNGEFWPQKESKDIVV